MPRGPRGEKRPADVIKNAIRIMRIATGEESEERPRTNRAEGGKVGGTARAARPPALKTVADDPISSSMARISSGIAGTFRQCAAEFHKPIHGRLRWTHAG